MKKEFIVERHGKSFVLYAGLLDEAHNQGLKSIHTTIVQIPNDGNGNVSIVQATVETEKGVFTGIGDAAPNNVTPPMRVYLLRMAETRAKARALRDAVNVGVVALEELSDSDDFSSEESSEKLVAHAENAKGVATSQIRTNSAPAILATPAQVKAIYIIGRNEHHLSDEEVDDHSRSLYGAAPSELSKRQASEFIDKLKATTAF